MQKIELDRQFNLDGKMIGQMRQNLANMMDYCAKHPITAPYATRSYLERAPHDDSEALWLAEYGRIIPRTFPVVVYRARGNKRLDGIMKRRFETVVREDVRMPFEKKSVRLRKEELVTTFSRLEFDVSNNPERLVYYQLGDGPQDIYWVLPVFCILNGDQTRFAGDTIPYERDQKLSRIDLWSPADSPERGFELWVRDENLPEAPFTFTELPLSMVLSRHAKRGEVERVYVPDELKHLDNLDIEHVTDLQEFLAARA